MTPSKRVPGSRVKATQKHAEEPAPRFSSALPFPVVMIGASAGGLAAFTALLKALPPKPGMAFVLIQHLEPAHKSALSAILSKTTGMAISEVADGTGVEQNRVYIIPPNKRMTLRKGRLRLTPRAGKSGVHRPIDEFALSLAEEQSTSAVGVILSGTGSDGTYGLKTIKTFGGVTFAQDPKTAEWRDMPLNAMTAGAVDFVLSPRRIAAELARIGRHPWLKEAREVPEGSDLEKVCLMLRTATGVDLSLYKQATIGSRIASRMALLKCATLSSYAQILKQKPDEAQALAEDVFIHVTSFFRDPECLQALRRRVLRKLAERNPSDDPIRIWVAGCSTGEEVYSIAILLFEEIGEPAPRIKIQIFGTDIQERAVEQARAGIYSETAVDGVSPARLKRFFIKCDHGYQIQRFVRDLCVFARHDLAKDPPLSRLDLVSCRNVLIYMGSALQKRALSIFQYALNPGAFLFLGNSESIGSNVDLFTPDDQKHRIFTGTPRLADYRALGSCEELSHRAAAPFGVAAAPAPVQQDILKEAEAALLAHYAPPAIIVDRELHIVHFQGDTSPWISLPIGQLSFHVLKVVRPELVPDLRAAISEARKLGRPAYRENNRFQDHGRGAIVRLEVRPLHPLKAAKQDLLVVFQKMAPGKEAAGDVLAMPSARNNRKIETLERELELARQQLGSLIAEHEIAQEEMKAAKEELQSSKEELVTLNEELQNHNAELTVITNDLTNLLVGIDIPIVVLDGDLRIRRFTPVAGRILRLIAPDVGRPFSGIASRLDVADWNELFSAVIRRESSVEREVKDREGHHYTLRLHPHVSSGNQIDGFLVVLLNTDPMRGAIEEARESHAVALAAQADAEGILNSMPAHIAVIGRDGVILDTNEAWDLFARENRALPMAAVSAGANYMEVCARAAAEGVSEAQAFMDGARSVLESRSQSFSLEYPCHSSTGERWFMANVTPLKGARGGAVVTHLNITERKVAEFALRQNEATIRSLLDSATQAVLSVNADGTIAFVNGHTEEMFGYKTDELIGQPILLLVPEESRLKHSVEHEGYFANMQSRPMGAGLTLESRRKDGTRFPCEIALSPIESTDGKRAVAFVSDITQRRILEQRAETHAKEVAALAAGLLHAQEDERRRLSRELHDQICQQLAALAIDIGSFAASPPPPDRSRQLKMLQGRVVRVSEEARHLAYELHPSVLDDLGLEASLQELCRDFSNRHNLAIECSSRALPVKVPREVASCLYRVAQESLNNAAKHAHAGHIKLALSSKKGSLLLTVIDDGKGFDANTGRTLGGLGLIGMEERAHLIGGDLTIGSAPGHGTRIALEIPLSPRS